MTLATAIGTKVLGQRLTSALYNSEVKANLEAINNQAATKHGATVHRTVAQTFAVGGDAVSWNAEAEDTDNYWSAGTPTRLTIPSGLGGVYAVEFLIQIGGTANFGQIGIQRIVGATVTMLTRSAFVAPMCSIAWTGPLAAGESVGAWVYANPGGTDGGVAAVATHEQPLTPHLCLYKVS